MEDVNDYRSITTTEISLMNTFVPIPSRLYRSTASNQLKYLHINCLGFIPVSHVIVFASPAPKQIRVAVDQKIMIGPYVEHAAHQIVVR